MRAPKPEDAKRFEIKQYHFLDDLSFVQRPADVFDESERDELEAFLAALRAQFTSAGWEGDGEIGVIWLPPFVDVGVEDTWGTYVWHVKQSNNGTSWLASDTNLNFKRLREQNDAQHYRDRVPVGIMFDSCRSLQKEVLRVASSLTRQVKALRASRSVIMAEIRDELILVAHSELISQLNFFLDGCYLQVLLEVLDYGNTSRLRLGKFKASLSPVAYIPELSDEKGQEDAEIGQWFTIKGLISDIWRSYKFEPFKQKEEMLFKTCDYKLDSAVQASMAKHVMLRNCIQHHDRYVTEDALRQAGVKEFTVLGADGSKVKLGKGRILLSVPEVLEFAKNLDRLAASFDAHMRQRVRTLQWVPKSLVSGALDE